MSVIHEDISAIEDKYKPKEGAAESRRSEDKECPVTSNNDGEDASSGAAVPLSGKRQKKTDRIKERDNDS